MKGLNIKGKDSLNEYLTHPLYQPNNCYCPSYKRSVISSKKEKQNKINKSLTINIFSHLNNINSSKLSESSPIRKNNSLKEEQEIYNEQNMIKNDLIKFPEIKEFNLYYEIPFHGKYDFIFLLKGNLDKSEWANKTTKLRNYPRHLKYTLFYQNDIKLQQIHKSSLSKIYQIFLRIKSVGLNLYNNNKFRDCLEQFNFAYGLFKWLEFRDKNIKLNEIMNNENFVILDRDIEEKIINYNNNKIENIYKASLIYILEIMAYCNIELRLFSNSIECLEECVILGKENFPDIYLRLAQARIYNKKSSDEELALAEKNINKGINLVLLHNTRNKNQRKYLIDINIYNKTKNKLNQIIKARLETKLKYIKALLKQNLNFKNNYLNNTNKNGENNDNVLYIKMNDINRQYKILKEIKKKYILAFKFFTESKNYPQLNLTYKEYETFYDIYQKFKFFYKFSSTSILNDNIFINLSPHEKRILNDLNSKKLIEKNKMNICEHIFMNGNYNNELYKYAVDKIFEEEKNKNEKDNKLNSIKKDINYSKRKCFVIKSSIGFLVLILISIWFQIYYLKSIRKAGYKSVYK